MITREEILKIAQLSKLYLSEEELPALVADMQKIVAFADSIGAAGELADPDFDGITGRVNVLREDEVLPSCPREEILKNADGGEQGYFPVLPRR